jgi:hypothetical protein
MCVCGLGSLYLRISGFAFHAMAKCLHNIGANEFEELAFIFYSEEQFTLDDWC